MQIHRQYAKYVRYYAKYAKYYAKQYDNIKIWQYDSMRNINISHCHMQDMLKNKWFFFNYSEYAQQHTKKYIAI